MSNQFTTGTGQSKTLSGTQAADDLVLAPDTTRALAGNALSFKQLLALNPADNLFSQVFVHDIGISGSFWMSNGSEWRPIGPVTLAAAHSLVSKSDLDTAFGTLFSLVIPGKLLGAHSTLRVEPDFGFPSSATNKNLRIMFGTATPYSKTRTTTSLELATAVISTRGYNLQQYPYSAGGIRGIGQTGTVPTSTLDTSVDQTLVVQGSWGTAGTGSNLISLTKCVVTLEY